MSLEKSTPWGSVVIPAHNEAAVLPRLLKLLAPALREGSIEMVVVANGCTDDTADIARAYSGVVVEELTQGSKIAALNRGDEVATAFPRVYLDADVMIPLETLRRLCEALDGPRAAGSPLAGRPRAVDDTDAAHPLVRASYRARRRAVGRDSVHLWGAGCYALSEQGRRRFERWPPVTGDDYWIDQMFAPEEKVETPGEPVRVQAPRTPAALVNVMARVHRGNASVNSDAQLSSGAGHAVTTGSTLRALAASVRGPRTFADAAAFTTFTVAGRLLARRRARHAAAPSWERDDSTRTPR